MSPVIDAGQLHAFSRRFALGKPSPLLAMKPEGDARNCLWYLATPYTSPDAAVRDQRALLATRMAAQLLCAGLNVYSPIAAHHPASLYMPDAEQPDHAGWMTICYEMLDRCDGLIVSTMDGYFASKGVTMEIERWIAREGKQRLVFASPIRENQPWVPRFSWQAKQVEGLLWSTR